MFEELTTGLLVEETVKQSDESWDAQQVGPDYVPLGDCQACQVCHETRSCCWLLSMGMAEPDGVLRKPLQLLGGGWSGGSKSGKEEAHWHVSSDRDRDEEHSSNQQFLLKGYRRKLRSPRYLLGFKSEQLGERWGIY